MSELHKCENLIVGAGIAGLTVALELLDKNCSVIVVDAKLQQSIGGQANDAFGGMLFVDTPLQRKNGIRDNQQLALNDWLSFAKFGKKDHWGRQWAQTYIEQSGENVYCWLKHKGISFLPVVHWVERGEYGDGNSVPRYHIAWGCGRGIVETLVRQINAHRNRNKLRYFFDTKVHDLTISNQQVKGCDGLHLGRELQFECENLIIATGGINGSFETVRRVWDPCYGDFPENLLFGCHPHADGLMHERAQQKGASVINLHQMWNYSAGVAHPTPAYSRHGLSLIPARSALWMDCFGNRVGPRAMVSGFDTHDLCCRTGHLPNQYGWQVMNWKIACKELAISGSDTNPAIRDKRWLTLIKNSLFGNQNMVRQLIEQCDDVVSATSLPMLVDKMNQITEQPLVSVENMERDILAYDQMIQRGARYYNDDQLRKIAQLRRWKGERIRSCRFQSILDKNHLPLIAIRYRLISRKSMGGFETNLSSQVLSDSGDSIKGLYAVGEAAGFGGGGCSGKRSLEGTFLSGCILTARAAASAIAK